MSKYLFSLAFLLFTALAFSQEGKTEYREYLTIRVQYGQTLSGYKYEVYVDIGTSGSHSLSGKVTNNEKSVTVVDDYGKYELTSDVDALNYFAKHGWVVIQTGEIDILDEHYFTYLLERKYLK